ncbi:hypothetical protein FB565_008575 [Actinoplanes lutulentus]|uniref:hypothetical protein n=1 Tax=Actinoplanes lutulentus TaxID=1287878 RepID=UPI0011B93624|nr:hypothetical protein [Actinoplanes lutulentus]MBB2948789.1 hypothetical protein [Actinoplanes lutulentus]
MSFDDDSMRALIQQLSPAQRGAAGAAALDRIRVVLDVDLEVDTLDETRRVVDEAVRVGLEQAAGRGSGNAGTVLSALRALLPDEADEDPFVGDEEWTVNVMTVALNAVLGGLSDGDSARFCFNALHCSYSVAGYLEDDLNVPYDQPYSDGEADQQMADIRYLADLGRAVDDDAIDHLRSSSNHLRDGYATRMRQVIEFF